MAAKTPAPASITPAEADALIRGITCEAVIRHMVAEGDPSPVLAALVRRYDAKAARREAKAVA